jgi:hypothetical protein
VLTVYRRSRKEGMDEQSEIPTGERIFVDSFTDRVMILVE